MTIKSAIYDIAKKHGYEGGEPRTTAEAINALTDLLAGEDVEEGHTIKEAVRALEPYIGAGGGGGAGTSFPVQLEIDPSKVDNSTFDEQVTGIYINDPDNTVFKAHLNTFRNLQRFSSDTITEIVCPNGFMSGLSKLNTFDAPNLKKLDAGGIFSSASLLGDLKFPSLETLSGGGFSGNSAARSYFFPKLKNAPTTVLAIQNPSAAVYIGPELESADSVMFGGFNGTINCAFSAERGAELGAPWNADDSATINYDVPVSSWPM